MRVGLVLTSPLRPPSRLRTELKPTLRLPATAGKSAGRSIGQGRRRLGVRADGLERREVCIDLGWKSLRGSVQNAYEAWPRKPLTPTGAKSTNRDTPVMLPWLFVAAWDRWLPADVRCGQTAPAFWLVRGWLSPGDSGRLREVGELGLIRRSAVRALR